MSRWKSREARVARSCSSVGNAASSFSRAAASSPAESELGGGAGHPGGEERLGLVRRQPGQACAVPAGEPVAAGRAAHRLDRHARSRERLDVAVDRAHGRLELLRELCGGQLAAGLEQEQERYEPRGTHLVNMTEDGLFVCKSLVHEHDANIWDDAVGRAAGGLVGRRRHVAKRLVPSGPAARREPLRARPGQLHGLPLPPRVGGAARRAARAADAAHARRASGNSRRARSSTSHSALTGAHEIRNDTDEPVRYVVAGIRVSPEVAEYPDLKQLTAQSRFPSQTGGPLFVIHDVQEEDADERRDERRRNVVELLLREPEIVAWLEDYRPKPDETPTTTTDPPHAA